MPRNEFKLGILLVLLVLSGCNIKRTESAEILRFNKYVEDSIEQCVEGKIRDFQCVAVLIDDVGYCSNSEESAMCEDNYYLIKKFYLGSDVDCDKFNDAELRSFCERIPEGDLSACDRIFKDGKRVAGCKAFMGGDISNCGEENIEFCSSLINERLAFSNGDTSFCDKMNAPGISDNLTCIALITKNVSLCKKDYGVCAKEVAANTVFLNLSVEFCQEIENSIVRDSCLQRRDDFYFDKGINNLEIGACENILSEEGRKACISVIDLDIELCSSIEEDSGMYKFMCIVQLAERMGRGAFCEMLDDGSRVRECYIYLKGLN